MECFRCKSRDFDYKKRTFQTFALLECFKCGQEYAVKSSVDELIPVDLVSHKCPVVNNVREYDVLKCIQCPTLIYRSAGASNSPTDICGLCRVTTRTPTGTKLSWSEFINK